MNKPISVIEDDSLSIVWAKAFLKAMSEPGGEVSPLIVRINNPGLVVSQKDKAIHNALSEALTQCKKSSIETVAGTIFPKSLWNKKGNRELLFERYSKTWPIIKKQQSNRKGTYFNRFIAFENGRKPINQLDHIIGTWLKKNHRHSALQMAVFDPKRDHNDCRQAGFPCLQQVDLNPLGVNGKDGLCITGFYATQHIFDKAYGNYLGLCRLGEFAAHEMKLKLTQVVCIASVAKASKESKNKLDKLTARLEALLK